MKPILLHSIFLSATIIFSACNKEDVPPPPDPRFPLPLLTKDTTGDMFINGKEPGSFLGKVVVDLYYGTNVKPLKMDLVVMKNNDKTFVRTLKAAVTTFPAIIQVTGEQLSTLFGAAVKSGDQFKIGADVTTTNGDKFTAFPVTGNPYDADTSNLPGSSFSIVYDVTDCAFDINSFDGFYTVVNSTWEYNAGDSIEVRPGSDNSILVTAWPHAENWSSTWDYTRDPMIVYIDPVTLTATVPSQIVGYYGWGASGVVAIHEGTGTVSPCGDSITLSLHLATNSMVTYPVLVLEK